MFRTPLIILLTALASAAILSAQTTAAGTIQAQGSANLNVQPDQAQLTVSVSTDAATAQQAASQNATQTNQVLTALKQALGNSGTVQTIGYTINPRYSNSANPTVIGYTAANTVQVTTSDLSLPGQLIDAASGSGATSVYGLTFGLRDPEPSKQQALTAATKQALAHAAAIAAGLGGKVGPVVSAVEGSTVVPIVTQSLGAASVTTPVLTGYVTVTANATVTVQLQ
jgi:uncharacterized protein YggE